MSVDAGQDVGPPDLGVDRRRFLTYLVAAPTLAVAVQSGLLASPAQALLGLPGLGQTPEPADLLDLGDVLILGAKATESQLIILAVEADGSVSCRLPREEVGQGITTAVAMIIADELGLPLDRVRVTLADARPELLTGQLTGGSNTIRSVYEPVRRAAAQVRRRMAAAAAARWGTSTVGFTISAGAVVRRDGTRLTFAQLAVAAASPTLRLPSQAPPVKGAKLVGTPVNRIDARAMVTGQMKYTLDLDVVPGAKPAMVRRPDTLRGRVDRITNLEAVRAMPGVLAVEVVNTGRNALSGLQAEESAVAVVAETFGQALDAKEALEVVWRPGGVAGEDDESIRRRLRGIQLPFTPVSQVLDAVGAIGGLLPIVGVVPKTVEAEFDFAFASHAPLETNTAIADVRADRADVWAGTKVPVVAQQTIEQAIGVPTTLHVVQGGGSFGRRLFFDSALEAARISQVTGMPVKLLWTRIDDTRHGRARAASHHKLRILHSGGRVLSFEQRVASVETDFRHGLGEVITGAGSQANLADQLPAGALPVSLGGNASFAQTVFLTTIASPYDFGITTQLLNELPLPFNTGSWRSVYSANTRGAEEILVDEVATALGKDPAQFRLDNLPGERERAVLRKVMELGDWGRSMPAGTAQGIAFHEEYRSVTACLVEIDARDPQDPRVIRATIAADYGLPINPRGAEAQLQGGLVDAIGTTLRAGLHLKDGLFLEGSYSQFRYPRQADVPNDVTVFVFPATTGDPGGGGELGVPAAVGAIANAYARATGIRPRSFPIVFPVDFTPFPTGSGSTRVQPR